MSDELLCPIEEPLNYCCLVKLVNRKREGLIHLLDETIEKDVAAADLVKVLQVNELAWTDKGYDEKTRPLQPGDYAYFQRYAGCVLAANLDECKQLRMVKDEEFVAKANIEFVKKYYEV